MRILVADDDIKLNRLICAALREARYNPDPAHTAKEALEKIRNKEFDLLLLDWIFDGETLDGKDLVKVISKSNKQTPILMLSGRSALADKIDMFDCGADDYLVKPFYLPEMLARIRSLLRRGKRERRKEKIKLDKLLLDLNNHDVFLENKKIELRNKEFQILKFLLENINETISRGELVESIWGEGENVILSNKLDVHMRGLRKALGDFGKRVKTIRGVGYCVESK